MEEKQFKQAELEDRSIIEQYLNHHTSRSCERTFANVYLWSRHYPVKWAIVEGALVFKSEDDTHVSYAFPAGDDESIKKALTQMEAYSHERGYAFSMYNLTPDNFEKLEEWYPGKYDIEYDRDEADYIYLSEKLAILSGKKLHGKRNHVNKFMKTYEGRWSYEPLTRENQEETFQMGLKWRTLNGCDENEEKNAEMCVSLNALRLFEELNLKGGVLRVDGEIVAFTIGEQICSDTFVVHIEKAFTEVEGAYPMINQQFVLHECMDYTYVNREDDAGSEGLRRAKLSYRPEFFVEKGYVKEKETKQ